MHLNFLQRFCCLLFLLVTGSIARGQTTIPITGPATVCKGISQIYTIAPAPGFIYIWRSGNTNGSLVSATAGNATFLWGLDGSGQVLVYGVNSNGDTLQRGTLNVTILPLPQPLITTDFRVACQSLVPPNEQQPMPPFEDSGCVKACSDNNVVYRATGNTGSTYSWSVNGGSIVGSANANPVTIHWNGPGQGSITVTETTTSGCKGSRTMCIEIIESPKARFVALPDTTRTSLVVCDSAEVIFLDKSFSPSSSPIVAWRWDFGDGQYSNAQGSLTMPVTHLFRTGSYTVTLTVTNACGCSTSYTMRVQVQPKAGAVITCPGVVCQGAISNYSVNTPCSASSWSVSNGSLISPAPGTTSVKWSGSPSGFGYLKYTPSCAGMCPNTTVVKVPIIMSTGTIEGEVTICPNGEYLYRLPQWPSTRFNWSMTPSGLGTLVPSDQPNEIILKTNGTAGTVTLRCNYQNTLLNCLGTASLVINIQPQEKINGQDKICLNTNYTYTLANGHSGTWTLTLNGATVGTGTGNSIVRSFTTPGIYVLNAAGTGFCPPDPLFIRAFPPPPNVNQITGPDTICKGVPVEYAAGNALYGTLFAWSMSGTNTGTVNSAAGDKSYVTLNPASSGPFTIMVYREMKEFPYCRSNVSTKTVYPPVVNPVITGNTTPCRNQSMAYNNSYPGAESYEWSVYPAVKGSVSGGQNTPNATIQWNDTNGAAKVICKIRKCFIFYIDTLNVQVSPAFPTTPVLTVLPDTQCVNQPVTVNVTGAPAGTIVYSFSDDPFPTTTSATSVNHIFKPFRGPDKAMEVAIFVPNPSGCPDGFSAKKQVWVKSAPIIDLSDNLSCLAPGQTKDTLMLTNTGSAWGNPPATTYDLYYYTAGGSTNPVLPSAAPMATSRILNPASEGFYFIEAVAANGCKAKSDTVQVADSCQFIPPPSGGGSSICDPSFSVSFNCTLTGGKRGTTVSWTGTSTGAALLGLRYYDPNLPGDHWSSLSASGSYTMSLAPGSYTMGIRVVRSTDSCTITNTITVPALPVANFTFARPITCIRDAAVVFTNTSTNAVATSGFWNFGDNADLAGYNAVRVYDTMPVSGSTYPVMLTVQDAAGCSSSITKSVQVIADRLEGATVSNPKNPCEGTPVTLSYTPNAGKFQGNRYNWLKQKDTIAVTTSSPTTVFNSGYYWVYVSDQYGCTDNAKADTVNIIQMPPVDIFGDKDACINTDYTLSGYAGAQATYRWFEGATTVGTAASLTRNQASPGSYTYTVEVTIPKPGGGACVKTSAPFTVTVHGNPANPGLSFNVVGCNPYEVRLTASPSLPGAYNWSNGASGNPVIVPTGGPFQVTYTDPFGCQSRTAIATPKDPHVYLWIFPSGCYNLCNTGTYSVTGPIVRFSRWTYYKNFPGIYMTGPGVVPTAVTFTSAGTYNLELNNGYCSAMSDDMDLSLIGCDGRPTSLNELHAQDAAMLTLAPNPARDNAHIDYRFEDNGKPHYLEIYDAAGRSVDSKLLLKRQGSWQLGLEHYAPGLYQVILRDAVQVLQRAKLSVVR
ncbi:PKD domain-containing protein [Taibaiella koreensis]|uniref:PKD domain-containing protein n=1 Tax=Taibaiella koreensis TaxID=1268548 RepID=UPI000E5A081E|nr:PKD domain-containing protein [Taibaiella koreensis]